VASPSCKGTLDLLLEAGWIRPRGRRKVPGRPMTWATTPAFLDHFGLASRDALPGIEELRAAGLLDRRPGVTLAMRLEEGQAEPELEFGLDLGSEPGAARRRMTARMPRILDRAAPCRRWKPFDSAALGRLRGPVHLP